MTDMLSGAPVISIEVTPRVIETARILGKDIQVRRPKDQTAIDFQTRVSKLKPVTDVKKGLSLGSIDEANEVFGFIWGYLREIIVSTDDYVNLRKRIYGDMDVIIAKDSRPPVYEEITAPADPDDDLEIKHIIKLVMDLNAYWEKQQKTVAT